MSNIKLFLELTGIGFVSIFVLFVIYAKSGQISVNKRKQTAAPVPDILQPQQPDRF